MSGPRRLAVLAVLLLSCLGLASVASGQSNSAQQSQIDNLFWIVTAMAVAIGIAVAFAIVWTVIRWRVRPGHKEPDPNLRTDHHGLEIAWTIVPAIILLTIGVLAFQTLNFTDTIPVSHVDVVVTVTGHQWYWVINETWTGNHTTISGLNNRLILFANQTAEFHILGADVAHSFFIPGLSFHIDAIPGHDNKGWLKPTMPGTYDFVCTQFCGVNHYTMFGTATVLAS
jgi:cytochrome c oxidase subunit II